ncbi:hypothetical protein WA158_008140 [Blastocystis sp. Blastoise]
MTSDVPRYTELAVQAHQNAQDEARQMLDQEIQLDSLEAAKTSLEQELLTTQTQLHGNVQTYLDELTTAMNIIGQTQAETIELQNRFNKMKQNCEQTLLTLQDNDVINQINLAQDNYNSISSQLSFLSKMTTSINLLHEKLQDNYKSLRVVYDAWIQYFTWKCHMQEKIFSISSEQLKNNARHVFSVYFDLIDQLGNEIHDKLWEHINRCIEMSQFDPASLVRALVIIERADIRRNKAIENRNRKLPYQAWMIEYKDYKEECFDRLRLAINRRCNGAYNKGEKLTEKLKIGMQLLSDLEVVKTKVVPCFPPHYNILNFFVHEYALVSQTQLESIYNNANLEPSEILSLIEWLESYNDEIVQWGCKEIDEFYGAKGRLMGKFTDVVKSKLSEWIQRLIDRNDKPFLTDTGYYATALPEDIYNLVKMQMQVATDHLKDKTLYLCIKVCVDTLSTYYDYVYTKVTQQPELLEAEELACYINNTKRLADLIEGIPDFLEENFDSDSLNELKEYIGKQSERYIDLCTTMAITIAKNIFNDIKESKIMETALFSDDWLEEEDSSAMLTVLSTYEDYFEDLKKWINSKLFYGHVIKTCLELTISDYFEKMSIASWVPEEPIMMGSRIRRDYDEIMGYFTNPDFLSAMKYVSREFRIEEGVAQLLAPLRNLEIFFKYPEFVLVEDGKVTQEGFTTIAEIIGSKLVKNGIYTLVRFRTDFSEEGKEILTQQFSMMN